MLQACVCCGLAMKCCDDAKEKRKKKGIIPLKMLQPRMYFLLWLVAYACMCVYVYVYVAFLPTYLPYRKGLDFNCPRTTEFTWSTRTSTALPVPPSTSGPFCEKPSHDALRPIML